VADGLGLPQGMASWQLTSGFWGIFYFPYIHAKRNPKIDSCEYGYFKDFVSNAVIYIYSTKKVKGYENLHI
jgi:hypothetical protein